jgi:mannose-6-phosphate isomerase-like protein (cupin superfamily)
MSFDFFANFVHVGGDGRALPVEAGPSFWQELATGNTESEGIRRILAGGWLCSAFHWKEDVKHWEMHPEGDELLFALSGRFEVLLEEKSVLLERGQFCLVPKGVWHRTKVHAPGDMLALTYGKGTQHRD